MAVCGVADCSFIDVSGSIANDSQRRSMKITNTFTSAVL